MSIAQAETPTEPEVPGAKPPSSSAASPARLPFRTILNFSAPTVGVGSMFFLVGLYMLPFATDVLLIAPAAVGTIFGISRIWDAISDPVAGFLSDRTNTRIGRRRPWMAAAILPISAVFIMMWSPPSALDATGLVLWTAVGVIGFYTAMTVFIVPHTALGAELTDDSHDRTRVFGTRHVVWSLGSVTAVGLMQLIIDADDQRQMAAYVGWGVAAVTGVLIGWAVFALRERPEFQGRGGENPLRSFRDVWRNPHARLLLIVFLIENLGAATIALLTPYVAKYVVKRPDLTYLFIMAYMVASIGFVPIWLPLSKRFGKKNLWVFSMLLTGFAFGGMFFLTEGAVVLISVLAALAGTAASCGAMVGPSIQADVIDYDEYATGERKEGAYFAAWNFVFKSATGCTAFLTGWVLQFVGFEANAVQTPQAELAIISLYSLFPLVCYLIGTSLFLTFKLDEAEHARIQAVLVERRGNS